MFTNESSLGKMGPSIRKRFEFFSKIPLKADTCDTDFVYFIATYICQVVYNLTATTKPVHFFYKRALNLKNYLEQMR